MSDSSRSLRVSGASGVLAGGVEKKSRQILSPFQVCQAISSNETTLPRPLEVNVKRQWIATWGECEASWTLAALAAELDCEADDLEAGLYA